MKLESAALRITVSIAVASGALPAQTLPRVQTEQALANVIKRVEPVTPTIAIEAKVGGPVASDVVIRANGTVESVTALAGPVLLHQAVVDALKQWTFKPFLIRGKPARVVAFIEVRFPDRSESRAVYEAYARALNQCQRHLESSPAPTAEKACAEAADRADKLSPDRRLERSNARALYGVSLLRNDRAKEAIEQLERARADRQRSTSDPDADTADNLQLMAMAHAKLGNSKMADELFSRSIRMTEAAIEALPVLRSSYVPQLQGSLRRYAEFKRSIGEEKAGLDLESRAARIDISSAARKPLTISLVDGIQCVCSSGWPGGSDLREIQPLLPKTLKPVWLIVSHWHRDESERNLSLFLEPDRVTTRYRRGRTVHVRPEVKPAGPRWSVAELPMDYIQVLEGGSSGATLTSPAAPTFPIGLTAYPSVTPLADEDIVTLVEFVRARGKADGAAAHASPRLHTDVQPWTIRQILNTGQVIEVFLNDPSGSGRGQRLSIRRDGTTWTILALSGTG